jgi:hypothetical protein
MNFSYEEIDVPGWTALIHSSPGLDMAPFWTALHEAQLDRALRSQKVEIADIKCSAWHYWVTSKVHIFPSPEDPAGCWTYWARVEVSVSLREDSPATLTIYGHGGSVEEAWEQFDRAKYPGELRGYL